MPDQEVKTQWAEANRRVLGELAELSMTAARETNDLLANLQRASLDTLRAQLTAWLRWQSLWPETLINLLRWYQQALQKGVETSQRAAELAGDHARELGQGADRAHAAAEQMGELVQEALSNSASRMREAARRVA